MASDAIYVGAYWGSRPEGVEPCASRLRRCLVALAAVSPVFDHWRPKGRTRSEAVGAEEVEASHLADALRRGVNRRDVDGSLIEKLGYSWSAWNGQSSSPSALSVTCGASASAAGVLNSFVLELPRPSNAGASVLYERPTVIEAVLAITNAWEPSFAVVTSHRLRESRDRKPGQPVLGWITYLASDRSVPQSLAGFDVLPVAGGTVVALARDWEGVLGADVETLEDMLDRSGALTPIV